MFLSLISNYTTFNFLDKKHVVNFNRVERKDKIDPLIGLLLDVLVNGNVCSSRTIIACMLVNHCKP